MLRGFGMACVYVLGTVGACLGSDRPPTFYEDALPVLQARCQVCHRPGQSAFPLISYRQTRPWAKAIREAVLTRKMPPWFADPAHGSFRNDRSLSRHEIDTLVKWIDAGAIEGETVANTPAPRFASDWNIGQPDLVLEMPTAFEVPASGDVPYQWVVMPLALPNDTWIRAIEARPGDRGVVHHMAVFYRLPGSRWLTDVPSGIPVSKGVGGPESGAADGAIGGYSPGMPPTDLADGRGILLPAGADLVLQMHYTPNGRATQDRSKVAMVFAKTPVKERFYFLNIANTTFTLPPGQESIRVTAARTLNTDIRLLDLTPHMHLRGKAFQFRLVHPDNTTETLLSVPRYLFNWQLTYQLREERTIPRGTRIEVEGLFDNSRNNPLNPDPTATVRVGDQTSDEMMVGMMGVAIGPTLDPSTVFVRGSTRTSSATSVYAAPGASK